MYPNGDVIQVQSSKIGTHELLIITNRKSYDPDMIDGYCIYKSRLITYYQTDSTNRDSIVRIDRLLKYEGKINGYKNAYATNVSFEPKQDIYIYIYIYIRFSIKTVSFKSRTFPN